MEIGKKQNTQHIMMVRPAFFRFNTQTDDNTFAVSIDSLPFEELSGRRIEEVDREINAFTDALRESSTNVFDLSSQTILHEFRRMYIMQEIHKLALKEFDQAVAQLRERGVSVYVMEDDPLHAPPDSIFSNNWVTFHQDGSVILYPMRAESRRKEVRPEVIQQLEREYGFEVSRLLDWTHKADERYFLEGTGSLVFDRVNNTAYAALSDRTHSELLVFFLSELDCRLIAFETLETANADGVPFPIYHTDVMMCIGESFVVICSEVIRNARQREKVLSELQVSGHEIVEISKDQLMAFAGNMLEVENDKGEKILCLSQQAYDSLRVKQIRQLEKHAHLEIFNIPVIEAVGGGGIRCMMTEIFLPRPRNGIEAPVTPKRSASKSRPKDKVQG